jgi:hypothetical protein
MPAQFDINQFRSVVAGGFAKPDRYRIRFPIPLGLNPFGTYYNISRFLEFYAESIQFVGVGFTTVNILRYGYGASEQKPIFPNFQEIQVVFYADAAGDNLRFFHDWANLVNNFNMKGGIVSPSADGVYPYEFAYKDDYVVDGMITLLNGFGDEVQTWHPRRMYPLQIPSIALTWSSTRDILKLTVIFTYMDWYREKVEEGQPLPATAFGGAGAGVPAGISAGSNAPQTSGTPTIINQTENKT